jgi:hypothetical protein
MTFAVPSLHVLNPVLGCRVDRIREQGTPRTSNFPASNSPAVAVKFIQDYIGICLVGLLIFTLALTTAGYVASYATQRDTIAFASDGHTITGAITGKHFKTVARSEWVYFQTASAAQAYWLDVNFQTPDGKYHTGSGDVSKMLYDSSDAGQLVKVTYLGSDPGRFYLADNAPTDLYAPIFTTIFRYGVIATLLVLIGITTMICWDGFDAMPVRRSRTCGTRGMLHVPYEVP